MAIKPLELQLVITQSNLADTKEAAAQKPIKFVLKRRGISAQPDEADQPTAPSEPIQIVKFLVRDEFGVPLVNKKYSLSVGHRFYAGTTGSDGAVNQSVTGTSQTGVLTVFLDDEDPEDQLTWTLNLAPIPPVTAIRGVQARLNNLGYNAGELTDTMNDQIRAAVREFQEFIEHPQPTGELDEQTRTELVKLHGS